MERIIIILFCCYLSTKTGQTNEIDKAIHADVRVSGDFSGFYTREKHCHPPREVKIDVVAGDVSLSLKALRSSRVTQYVPTYVVDTGTSENSELRRVTHVNNETYALYHDKNHAAAFVITCPKNGESEPLVEGTIYYSGHPHHLRVSTWRRHPVSVKVTEPVYHLVPVNHTGNERFLYDYHKPDHSRTQNAAEKEILADIQSARFRRQFFHTDVIIDVIAVIAYDLYNDFYHQSGKTPAEDIRADTYNSIKKHFAMVISETDLLYQRITTLPFRISIRLAGFIIAETANASPWTEQLKENRGTGHKPLVNSDKALDRMRQWVENTNSIRPMDYYVLFTNYDLYGDSPESGISTSNCGVAFLEGLCVTGKNTAVVEAFNFAQSILTTAHELGHALGAEHDGDKNDCRSSDNYIMASESIAITPANVVSFGRFSNCSLLYFARSVDRMTASPTQRRCISEAATPVDVPSINGVVPGQINDVDSQCRQFQGNGSYICTTLTHSGDSVCTELFCHVPGTVDRCESTYALRGTTCGSGKGCENGRCVRFPGAPTVDDTCLFGDRRDPPFTHSNQSCQQSIKAEGFQCYTSGIAHVCCQSCGRIRQDVPGCEYGDKAVNCDVARCSLYTADSKRSCCRTCGPHTAAPVTALPTTPQINSPPVSAQSSVYQIYPGINTTLSQQCIIFNGPTSTLCASLNFGEPLENLCHKGLYCTLPHSWTQCNGNTALNGTPCGKDRYCANGFCVNLMLPHLFG